ncbi:hypothetical protein LIER_31144 [Lithospermum erythrorhizon]|uniref:VQ domain-containing protein n=1 Tax=Lithospermum erythrorhizon TaxID=34254 RepID=A0AAV3RQ34_LITER
MASSDNLMAMDPSWMFRNALPETWFQKSFETQFLDNINFSIDEFISPCYLNNSNASDTTATTVSGENNSNTTLAVDVVTSRKRNNNNGVVGGKIVKRKSRASKRSTTTFINADVANFRRLVQEVTGVKFGGVVKPEPLRGVNRLEVIGGGGVVSTLDTSAFLLEASHRNNREMVGGGGAPTETVVADGGPASSSHSQFDFDSFCSFPTLESWKGI